MLGIALAIAASQSFGRSRRARDHRRRFGDTDVLGGAQLWAVSAARALRPNAAGLVADGTAPNITVPAAGPHPGLYGVPDIQLDSTVSLPDRRNRQWSSPFGFGVAKADSTCIPVTDRCRRAEASS